MYRRADSVEDSYDKLVAVLTLKDKLAEIAGVNRKINREIRDVTNGVKDLFESMEKAGEPTMQLVVPAYYLMAKRLQPVQGQTQVAAKFRFNLMKYMDSKFWTSIKALHWLACFLDPSFRNFGFLPHVTPADQRFKRDLLNDVDDWILAEMQPAAKSIAETQATEATSENAEIILPPAPKKRKEDPFAEMRSLPSTGEQQNMDRHITNNAAEVLEACRQELASYKGLRVAADSKDPLTFWRDNASDYPILAETSRRLYCISASSAQSERDFSSVGNSITDKRSMLSSKKIEAIELVRWAMRGDSLY